MIIRSEKKEEYEIITKINDKAFKGKQEGTLIKKLRNKKGYDSELSLVAIKNDEIIGHVLLFPIYIKTNETKIKTLSLAPLAVHPNHQRQGVGKELIKKSIETAKRKKYESILVIGHPEYYPKFGFRKSTEFKIKLSKEYSKVPKEAFMILELKNNCLKNIEGTVQFPEEYLEAM